MPATSKGYFIAAILLLMLFSCATMGTKKSSARAVATIPFALANNLILVPVSINGSEPAFFILDTGAESSVINTTLAQQLGLSLDAGEDVSTTGGTIGGSVTKVSAVTLGEVDLGGLSLLVIPLAGVEAGLGRTVGGILGAEVFDRFVVEIDYAARIIRLYDPAAYRYAGTGTPLPVTFENHTPFLRAVVQSTGAVPIQSHLLIDTGGSGALTLNTLFVNRHRLLETSQHIIPITSGAILAGQAKTYVGRLRELRFGDTRLAQPVANFSQDTEGDEASASNDGFIGAEVLRRFKLITDYVHARIILEPTDGASEPFEFDMSGISLAAAGSNFEVTRVRLVIPDSPAAEAGVSVGDILTAIDGVPARSLGLDKIRQMLRTADKEYRLSLTRGKGSFDVKIKTGRLI